MIKLKKPELLFIEDNDIIIVNDVRYIVNSIYYDQHGYVTEINATNVDVAPSYDLSGFIDEEQ